MLSLTACGHEHKYTDVITAPTCTTLGYTVHTCECGDRYTDAFIANNYNTGANFCNTVSNSNITIENNIFKDLPENAYRIEVKNTENFVFKGNKTDKKINFTIELFQTMRK